MKGSKFFLDNQSCSVNFRLLSVLDFSSSIHLAVTTDFQINGTEISTIFVMQDSNHKEQKSGEPARDSNLGFDQSSQSQQVDTSSHDTHGAGLHQHILSRLDKSQHDLERELKDLERLERRRAELEQELEDHKERREGFVERYEASVKGDFIMTFDNNDEMLQWILDDIKQHQPKESDDTPVEPPTVEEERKMWTDLAKSVEAQRMTLESRIASFNIGEREIHEEPCNEKSF